MPPQVVPLPSSDPRRNLVIALAQGELGTVSAKEADPATATWTVKRRRGWLNLQKYFNLAAPGQWPDDIVVNLKEGLPSWCGIFALWAFKAAGLAVGNWKKGDGIASIPGFVCIGDNKATPQPGDVGYIKKPAGCTSEVHHHNIITKLVGTTVHTIDANSYESEGNNGSKGSNGRIIPKQRQKSEYDNFYSITAAAGGVVAVPAAPPAVFTPIGSPLEPWAPFPTTPPTTPAGGAGGGSYTVCPGDTLQKISLQKYGTVSKWNVIYNANKQKIGPDPGKIYVGQVLTIP